MVGAGVSPAKLDHTGASSSCSTGAAVTAAQQQLSNSSISPAKLDQNGLEMQPESGRYRSGGKKSDKTGMRWRQGRMGIRPEAQEPGQVAVLAAVSPAKLDHAGAPVPHSASAAVVGSGGAG